MGQNGVRGPANPRALLVRASAQVCPGGSQLGVFRYGRANGTYAIPAATSDPRGKEGRWGLGN